MISAGIILKALMQYMQQRPLLEGFIKNQPAIVLHRAQGFTIAHGG